MQNYSAEYFCDTRCEIRYFNVQITKVYLDDVQG